MRQALAYMLVMLLALTVVQHCTRVAPRSVRQHNNQRNELLENL